MTTMENLYKQFAGLGTAWRRDLLLRARVKLTAAYVAVSAVVLGIFSYLLYGALLARLTESINEDVLSIVAQELFFERASEALQSQILIADAITLFFILIFAYVLTGLTLKPIRVARDRERRFLADAAHELRTPLSVMKSGNEVVLRGETDISPRLKRLLTENVEEIDSLTRIANGLLLLASEKEKVIDAESATQIYDVIASVVKKLTPRTQERQLSISFTSDENAKASTVCGNKTDLARAFENLIENAIKYTKPSGSVRVSLERTGNAAVIVVSDTGIGISKEDLAHVFEPFFRADTARTSMEGSGLGLSIVSEIVEAHGGKMNIESELGVGTIVRVTLPLLIT